MIVKPLEDYEDVRPFTEASRAAVETAVLTDAPYIAGSPEYIEIRDHILEVTQGVQSQIRLDLLALLESNTTERAEEVREDKERERARIEAEKLREAA